MKKKKSLLEHAENRICSHAWGGIIKNHRTTNNITDNEVSHGAALLFIPSLNGKYTTPQTQITTLGTT